MNILRAFLMVVLSCASIGSAQKTTGIIAVATFNNIGIEVSLSAAPPSGAGINVSWNLPNSSLPWHVSHPLSLVTSSRFAGSVFNLANGTAYILRLQGTGFSLDTAITISTRSDNFPVPTGTVYHVSKAGNDTHTGTSTTESFATLRHALSVAQSGATILLHSGRYYEEVILPRSGTATAPILIRNAPGEKAVLDGRDTSFKPVWTAYDAGAAIYRTPCSVQPQLAFHNGGHLFASPTLVDLVSNTWSMPAGFFCDGSYLYVRLPHTGAPTTGDTVSIPAYTTAVTGSNSQYIQIRGLEICYYGLDDYSRGIYFDGASYCLVDSCFLHHNGIGVALKRVCLFNTIQRCTFSETPIDTWNWSAVKEGTGYYEAGGVVVYGSSSANTGNVIRRNLFSHMFDGSHLYSDDVSGPTSNMDFHDNIVEFANDDCVETDGAGTNCRIYNNTFRKFLTGVSVAPAAGGPTYIMRNVFTGWETHSGYDGYPVKFNVSSSLSIDWVYLYHNTCYTAASGQPGFLFKQYSNWHNVISRNNIYAGTDYALESTSSQNPVDFDYDDLYTNASGKLVNWSGAKYTAISTFYAAAGQEQHGQSDLPGFSNAAGADFILSPSSQLIDKGFVIPGINNDYQGNAPDIGCFEYGAAPVLKGPMQRSTRLSPVVVSIPAKGRVVFLVKDAISGVEHASITVYSLRGTIVYSVPLSGKQKSIVWNASQSAAGCYITKLALNGKSNYTNFMLTQ
jgi:hypothetical protein